jgi:hypothetical protein
MQGGKYSGKGPLELVHQQGGAFGSPSLVANGIFNLDLIENCSVVQLDQKGISDRALRGVVVVDAEALLLDTIDLGAESIDAGVRRRGVGAVDD